MKHKKLETLLYSAIGVAVMFGLVLAVNVLAGAVRKRVDLTEDKLFTLSAGTRAILKKIDSPVEIRFYFSQSETRVPSDVRTYAVQVEDLLDEFREASNGKIRVHKIDPKPDTDTEEKAQGDGIEAQPTGPFSQESYYFGLVVSLDPEKAAIPHLDRGRERLLEYDLARAIGGVISTSKPVVGVMTALPMFGMPMNPMMMRMGQRGQRPWVFIQELRRDYTVKQVQMDADHIDDDIQVLLVAHPKNITDKAQYAIDQFVLRGGKLLALLDGMCFIDRDQSQPNNPLAGQLPGGGSSLPKLLQAWGVAFESSKVVADLTFSRELPQQNQRMQKMPTILFLNPDGINRQDVLTAQIDDIWLVHSGAFSGTPATGLQQTVLLHSTKKSELVDGMTAHFSPQKALDDFKPSGTEQELALRLKGKFKTAFPEGKPAEPKSDDDKEKKDEKKPAENSLKESKTESVVILVGDSDFLFDDFCVQINPLFGVATPKNGNLSFAENMIEQLAGDANLVGTRSRGALRRPFTRIQNMEAAAQEQYQDRIQKLNKELQDAQQQLSEMQAKKEPGQKQILSPEQQAKIQEFQAKKRKTEKELRELRKKLREDIDSMQGKLKLANIAGMPALVVIAGLSVFFLRKQRTKAQ